MNSGGEIAELMVKESIQITEESIKLLAAGSKNLAALLWALATDSKKLAGMSSMKRLIREGKELRVFCIRESDLDNFKAYAKKNVLYSIVKDKRAEDGTVDLITNVDYAAQVNLFMERYGYAAPKKEEADPKKTRPALNKTAPRNSAGLARKHRNRGRRILRQTVRPRASGGTARGFGRHEGRCACTRADDRQINQDTIGGKEYGRP